MKNENQGTRLRLVKKHERVPIRKDDFAESGPQTALFPSPRKDLLLFVVFPRVTEEEFTTVLDNAKPRVILELRRAPRFDIGNLNRLEAFAMFQMSDSKYYDLSSQLVLRSSHDAGDPLALVDQFLDKVGSRIDGPVMLLLNDDLSAENLPGLIAQKFTAASKSSWTIFEVPQFR